MNLIAKLFPKKRSITVELCSKNLDRFLKEEDESRFGAVFNQNGVYYKEYKCQNHCKICKSSPYGMINGELITAEDCRELVSKIEQKVLEG
ncbi:DUF1450 domain-containing protein [Bacillus sp. AK031]